MTLIGYGKPPKEKENIMRKMVIAVDFDGTLCEHDFPEIGEIGAVHQKVIEHLRFAKSQGDTIILWTCREDLPERNYLSEAVAWCEENGIPIDYVNEYPMPGFKGFATRKVCADVYIDDKALNLSEFAK
jgi:hypothetical protein